MPHGKICYLEIPARTGEESAAFYSRIFGWKTRTRGDGELAFDDPGGVSGTWVKESHRIPDETTRIYIMVDNIAETLKEIGEQLGLTRERVRQIETEALNKMADSMEDPRERAEFESDD